MKDVKIKIYKTIMLSVVLYGCEIWSLALKEEQRLREFDNRVLRTIFGPNKNEMTGEWRKLHNKELPGLYSSPSIIRIIKSRMMRWERRGTHLSYWWKARGKVTARKTKT
jgi:hypothetical protein